MRSHSRAADVAQAFKGFSAAGAVFVALCASVSSLRRVVRGDGVSSSAIGVTRAVAAMAWGPTQHAAAA